MSVDYSLDTDILLCAAAGRGCRRGEAQTSLGVDRQRGFWPLRAVVARVLRHRHSKDREKVIRRVSAGMDGAVGGLSLASQSTVTFLLLTLLSCSPTENPSNGNLQLGSPRDQALVLALAVLGEDADGKPKPLPARMVILQRAGATWNSRFIEDPASTAFHKAMAYKPAQGHGGVLTLGGAAAAVKFWAPGKDPETLWEADFGGKFSRMRDAEAGDIYGDGSSAIAVVTHDQGVVATLRRKPDGGVQIEELDRQPGVIVHEVELGDLDGDGVLEIYATPSAPNLMDGTPQHGQVVRYVPALGKTREEIVDLGDRHAKEILVDDLDNDGRDELYISVEAISGGQVEIRRYSESDDGQSSLTTVARLNDKLCRFLTTGDIDGDGKREYGGGHQPQRAVALASRFGEVGCVSDRQGFFGVRARLDSPGP